MLATREARCRIQGLAHGQMHNENTVRGATVFVGGQRSPRSARYRPANRPASFIVHLFRTACQWLYRPDQQVTMFTLGAGRSRINRPTDSSTKQECACAIFHKQRRTSLATVGGIGESEFLQRLAGTAQPGATNSSVGRDRLGCGWCQASTCP